MSATEPTAPRDAVSQPRPEKKRLSELSLRFRGWAIQVGNQELPTNPDRPSIARAVTLAKAGQFQELVFDSQEFKAEWAKRAAEGFDKLFAWVMDYHAGRVAYFVAKGWDKTPIEVMANGDMKEGQHRLMAAMFMELKEVDVLVF